MTSTKSEFADMLSRHGFDVPRLGFNLRTALAGFIALAIAWWLGLEHPQWAAMTVWSASLPVRGQLLEKSGYRLAGTVVGTVFGTALVALSHGDPSILVAGLALWIGLCAGAGNVVRGFLSYGTMLAGYSASMVALLDTAHPDHVFALGFDRFLTVAVGVLVALAIGWVFGADASEDALSIRVRRVTVQLLRLLAQNFRGMTAEGAVAQRPILSELAAIDDVLEAHGAGSLKSRRSVRAIRSLISGQVTALLSANGDRLPVAPEFAVALDSLASAIEAHHPEADLQAALNAVEMAAKMHPAAQTAITEFLVGIRGYIAEPVRQETMTLRMLPVLHRDWVGAMQAAIRACGAMLAVGIFWLATGWSIGPFMLLGVSIMASLFSTADNPAAIVRMVFFGQIFGAIGALCMRWFVWPHASSEFELIMMMLPFMLVGPFVQSHRKSAPTGFDYNMVLLLLSHPSLPLTGTFLQSLAMAAAVVAGPLIAIIAYRLVFPTDLKRRRDTLVSMMVHELEAMAGTAGIDAHRDVWQARLNHRVLRLVRWSDKIGSDDDLSETEGGLAVLAVGNAILHIDSLMRQPGLTQSSQRTLSAVLRRLKSLQHAPERAGRVLQGAAARMVSEPTAQPELFRVAAQYLDQNAAFFRQQ